MDSKVIGERIRQQRKMKGLTQEELALKVDISTMSIRRYEGGERVITENVIKRIADALGVPVSSLLYDGTIDLHLDGVKNPENMTPEELKEYVESMPKAFEELKKAAGDIADKILDIHADGDVLLLQYYNMLNHKGRKEAIKRTAELARQDEYTVPDNPNPSK